MKVLLFNRWSLLLLLIALGIGIGYGRNLNTSKKVVRESRKVKVQRTDLIQRVTVAGNVEPKRKTIVAAPFNGYVKVLYVKVGDRVKKGDPLVSVVQSLQATDPVFPLRSPFAGVVVQVLKDEGEFVKQDDAKEYILRVDSLDEIYVVSDVPEIDTLKIVLGQEAIIKASAILDKKYSGVVEEISLAAKPQDDWRGRSKVEYRTRIKVKDFDEELKPGMSAIIDIITKRKESVLVVPHEYVLRADDKFFVLLPDGQRREIMVGLQNESYLEVLEGLSENQILKQVDFMEVLGDR